IAGYPTLRTQPGGEVQNDHNWGFADTMTWNTGRHVVRFGGEYKPQNRFRGNVPEGNYGSFNFNGSLTGYGYADFLLGLPFSSSRLDPLTNRKLTDSELGIFITDSWKVSNRLTLDIGLRWDRFGSATYDDGLVYNWDPGTGNVIISQNAMDKVSPLYPTTITLAAGNPRPNPSNTNFVPRIGAAYRLSDKTVLRGGYGIFNETIGRYARAVTGGPFEITETYNNQIVNGQPLLQFPNPFPSSLAGANIPSQSVTGFPRDTDNGKIHQFNLTVERQVGETGLKLAYIGSRNRGMNYNIGINKPEASLIPFTLARRPWPQFVGTTYARSDGKANYNAMLVEVQRKVGMLTLNAHWTWSSNYNTTTILQDPYAEPVWSRDPFTARHRVVVNTVWELPVGKGRRYLAGAPAVAEHILGGWQLYWIAYFETGQFFSPSFSGRDPSNTNTVGGLPDRICDGNLPAGERSIDRWFDASCFAVPPTGRFGNSGAYVLEGPGLHMHNISLA
ncbi:MAG: TonB-dependent receptor, partial [Bryobacteraceae bacterium]|nr:TonB-dependent receptor [Bryobacteraceae bacterium]